ncbi:Alpha/beta hydrolase [Gracilaria domingensis]|nr:Alpha/beta hydrolase [Gracilaria domingensis]
MSSQLTSFTFDTKDGAKIALSTHSVGENKQAALFLHDFMTDSRLFHPLFNQAETLSDCKLVACDLRGYGKSTDPTGAYSHMDDIDAVLDHFQIKQVHLVGAGMGGIIALEYAIARRQRTTSVALFGSGLPGHRWSAKHFMDVSEARFVGRMRSVGAKYVIGTESARNPVTWKQSFITLNETWSAPLRSGDKQVAKRLLSMAKTYRAFHFFMSDPVIPQLSDADPLRERLGEIQLPVLVAVGKNDTQDFLDIAREIAAGVGAEPVYIDDSRHFVPLEQPAVMAELLKQFWWKVCEERKHVGTDAK